MHITANTFKKAQILTKRIDKFIRQEISYFGRKKSLKKIWLNILLAGFYIFCICGECVRVRVCVCACIAFLKGMEYGLAPFSMVM